MRIQGQDIIKTKDYLGFKLIAPFWSAYQRFAWENKEPGFGISTDLLKEAVSKKKNIVVIYKDIRYQISPITVRNFYKKSRIKPVFSARGKVDLIIVPQSKFLALKKEEVKDGGWTNKGLQGFLDCWKKLKIRKCL